VRSANGRSPATDRDSGESSIASAAAVLILAVFGLACGAGTWVLADSLSRTDIGGPGWSLRGNGALVVPFSLGPALLDGGWAAYVWWHRRQRHWALAGVAAGAAAFVIALLAVLLPTALAVMRAPGSMVGIVSGASLAGFVAALIGPVGVIAYLSRGGHGRRPLAWAVVALALLPLALVVGFYGTQRITSSRAASLPGPRSAHQAIHLDDARVLAAGGSAPAVPSSSTIVSASMAEIYDLSPDN